MSSRFFGKQWRPWWNVTTMIWLVWLDSLCPTQQFFLGWTSTKQGLLCLAQGYNTVPPAKPNLQSLSLEPSNLPLHSTATTINISSGSALFCKDKTKSSWQKYTIFVTLKNLPVTPSNTKWAIPYSIKCMIGKWIRMKRVEHLLANLKLLNWCVSYTEF